MANPAPMLPKDGGSGKIAVSDLNANKRIKVVDITTDNSSIDTLKEFFVRYGVQPTGAPHESEPDGLAGKQQVKMSNFKENTFLGLQMYARNETETTYADAEDCAISVTQWPPANKGGYACSFEFQLTHPSGIQDTVVHNRNGLIVNIPEVKSSSATKHFVKSASIPGTGGTLVHLEAQTAVGATIVLVGTGGKKASFSGEIEIGFDKDGGVPALATGSGDFGGTISETVTVKGTSYYKSKTITADGLASVEQLCNDNDAVVTSGDGSLVPDDGKTITLSGGTELKYEKRDIYLAPGATGDELNGQKIIGDGVKTIRELVISANAEFNLIPDETLGLDSARPSDGKSTVSSADSRAANKVAPNAPRDDDVLKAGEEIEFSGGEPGSTIDALVAAHNKNPGGKAKLNVIEGGDASPSAGAKILVAGGRAAGVRLPNTGSHSSFANFGAGNEVWSGIAIKAVYVTNTVSKTTSRRDYTLQVTAILPDSTEDNPAASSFSIGLSPGGGRNNNRFWAFGPDKKDDGLPQPRALKFPKRNASGDVTSDQSGDRTLSQNRNFDWSYQQVWMSGAPHPDGDSYGTRSKDSIHYNR